MTIVGLGEALFDLFPDREVLGGAPLNVAVHAHQLAEVLGGRGVVVSRIGQDDLGRQLLADVTGRKMTAEYIQTDPDHPTGRVYVGFDDRGEPSFDIVRGVAWDWLQFDPDLEALAASCQAVCFGSLAQREAQARNTIYRFLTAAKEAVRLFDVNLRQQYFDRQILEKSFALATAIKLNDQELPVVARTVGLGEIAGGDEGLDQGAKLLVKRFGVKLLALTRGARGTVIYTAGERFEDQPVSYPAAKGGDAVGAGDACSAGLLVGLLLRWPMKKTLALANHTGAFVASQPGATPKLPESILGQVKG
jgi:fructokinase